MKKRFVMVLLVLLIITFTSTCQVFAADNKYKITGDDMIYFIMTDRFYDGDTSNNSEVNKNDPSAYHGGDFQGVIDKLDYIKDLGFTAIWITPVVKNQPGGYHGYWAVDFYNTDEHLGSIDKLKELVQKAHSKGIKVIIDLVVNHTGEQHPWVNDPKYSSWFHDKVIISNYNDQEQVENGWLSGLPDFNQQNAEAKKYLIDMAKWWIKETNVDGYRLDTMKHVSKDFWSEFTREIKKDYPDFYLIGEVFQGDVNYVSDYQNTGVDGLADFPGYYAITDVFKNGSPEMKLEDIIEKSKSYKNSHLLGTFIDNHDVPRFVNGIDKFRDEKLKQALTFMMTYTGIPIMYYGTEIGMDGGADPDNRRDMDWNASSGITSYVKKLTSIRKTSEAIRAGDIKTAGTDPDVLCYIREYKDEVAVVVFNTMDSEKKVEIPVSGVNVPSGKLHRLLEDRDESLINGVLSFNMKPHGVEILSSKDVNAIKPSSTKYLIIIVPLLSGLLVLFGIVVMRKKVRYLKG